MEPLKILGQNGNKPTLFCPALHSTQNKRGATPICLLLPSAQYSIHRTINFPYYTETAYLKVNYVHKWG